MDLVIHQHPLLVVMLLMMMLLMMQPLLLTKNMAIIKAMYQLVYPYVLILHMVDTSLVNNHRPMLILVDQTKKMTMMKMLSSLSVMIIVDDHQKLFLLPSLLDSFSSSYCFHFWGYHHYSTKTMMMLKTNTVVDYQQRILKTIANHIDDAVVVDVAVDVGSGNLMVLVVVVVK